MDAITHKKILLEKKKWYKPNLICLGAKGTKGGPYVNFNEATAGHTDGSHTEPLGQS